MTQPTKREQLAAMRLEEFKAHLRMFAGKVARRSIRVRAPVVETTGILHI
jgi:hypothetical protein